MVTIQHYLGSARSNLFRITLSYLDFLLLLLSCCCSAAQLCLTLCDPMVVGTFKYILYSKFLSDIWFAKYFLSFCKCLLTLLIFFFSCKKLSRLMQFHLSIFVSVVCAFGFVFKKSLTRLMSWSFSLFSSRSFTGMGVIFKSLINFRLILCMTWVDFIPLHVDNKFFQHS